MKFETSFIFPKRPITHNSSNSLNILVRGAWLTWCRASKDLVLLLGYRRDVRLVWAPSPLPWNCRWSRQGSIGKDPQRYHTYEDSLSIVCVREEEGGGKERERECESVRVYVCVCVCVCMCVDMVSTQCIYIVHTAVLKLLDKSVHVMILSVFSHALTCSYLCYTHAKPHPWHQKLATLYSYIILCTYKKLRGRHLLGKFGWMHSGLPPASESVLTPPINNQTWPPLTCIYSPTITMYSCCSKSII